MTNKRATRQTPLITIHRPCRAINAKRYARRIRIIGRLMKPYGINGRDPLAR